MFKNLIVYRIGAGWSVTLEQLEEGLSKARFAPCGATQERSAGWVEPRGAAHGPLAESVDGQWILKHMVEAKVVPAAVIKRRIEERKAQIEKETGRKPGRKESKELKDEVMLDLLPMAFTKESAALVWIDPEAQLLVLDTSTQARADELVTTLAEAMPGLAAAQIDTQVTAVAAMSEWLVSQQPPAGFSVDRECELKASDESKAVVRYGRHPLDIEEVRQHIGQGKLPTRPALTWDERVSFVLTEGLRLRKLDFLDGVFDGTTGKKEDGFDADVALSTGELRKLIPDLLEALGGEVAAGTLRAASGSHAALVQDVKTHVQNLEAMARENRTRMEIADDKGRTLLSFGDGPDPMYEQAVAIVKKEARASISLVQRHLKLGYNRAAQLLEDMEKAGVVSPMGADGSRTVT